MKLDMLYIHHQIIDIKIKKLEKEITTNSNLIIRTEKEENFFVEHDVCPKCTQPM